MNLSIHGIQQKYTHLHTHTFIKIVLTLAHTRWIYISHGDALLSVLYVGKSEKPLQHRQFNAMQLKVHAHKVYITPFFYKEETRKKLEVMRMLLNVGQQ